MTYTKKVAFVMCRYPLGISSMIVNSIRLFAERGISVDVYISKKSFEECPINFSESNIRIFIFDDKGFGLYFRGYRFFMRHASNIMYPLMKRCGLRTGVRFTFPEIFRFSSWLKSLTDFEDYDYVFPVDCHSLISLYNMLKTDKLIYYDMELLNWDSKDKLYGNKLILKDLEYRLIQLLQCVVLASRARAESFCRINKFSSSKIQILPVASMGNPVSGVNNYFRKKFSIPEDHIIIVYSGNFVSWFQCIEIIDAMRSVKNRACSLVMHTWNQSSTESGYFKDMVRHASGLPVFFSTEYISGDEFTKVLSSADIGLAFYADLDDNFTEILFSSNKIGEYLKAGLPIITSDFKPLHDFIRETKVGLAVPVQELSKAIEDIARQLEEYKSNALACYNTLYRFESYFEKYYEFLYVRG